MPGKEPGWRYAVILTALPIEYTAVRAYLQRPREELHKGTIYERGNFIAGGQRWEIGIAQIGAGNSPAAFEAERAIAYFDPEIALFVGVAGGIKDVAPGDVVAATRIYGYESGTAQGTSFLSRPDVGESSYRLIQRARVEARKKDWLQRIRGRELMKASPRVFIGPIAAGEKVVASTRSDIFTFLYTHYNDALAIEMEGRGFLQATHGNEHVQALIVRGVSDLLDDKSYADAHGSQEIAARHASAFAFEILAKLDTNAIGKSAQPAHSVHHLSFPQQTVIPEAKPDLYLEDLYINEHDNTPVLDITLHNNGTQVALPTRVKIDILDVGEFYRCDEDDDDIDTTRSFLAVTNDYDVMLSPELKGQSKLVKIAHQLRPGDTDRFHLTIDQDLEDSALAYIWYYLKITIIYNGQGHALEAMPILLSVPPVDRLLHNVWDSMSHAACAAQNRATLGRMSALTGNRSDSVEATIRQVLSKK